MTRLQLIEIVVVALLGLFLFYCIYDVSFRNEEKRRKSRNRRKK